MTTHDRMPTYADLLDPEIMATLAAIPLGEMSAEVVAMARAAAGLMPRPVLADTVERTEYHVPDSTVRLRLHRPVGAVGPLPCIYWIHGGGYVLGDFEMDDLRLQRWCEQLGCCAVAVEYRLAPDDPYPAAIDDCQLGLHWVVEHAAKLGIDPTRLGVGGESAGGGLAAALALRERDRGAATLAFQLLVYPMLDDRMATVSSAWPDPVWSPGSNRFGWTSYVGHLDGYVPADGAPARAIDLSGLPPTLIAVGGCDVFSDEDIEYATRLRHGGVSTELHVYRGAPHGFLTLTPGSAIGRQANADVERWLRAVIPMG